jgi:hypothetical protein
VTTIIATTRRGRATRRHAGEEAFDGPLQGFEHNVGQQSLAPLPIREASRPTAASRVPAGILLYLIVIGLAATATIGVFFGIGLSMLVPPIEEKIAGSGTDDRSPELDPLRPGVLSRSDSDGSPALAVDHAAPGSAIEAPPQLPATAASQADVARQSENPIAEADLVVAQWGFGYSLETARKQALQGDQVRSGPLYLSMTLNGTQSAVDRMRTGSLPAINVRWERENDGAPANVVELTIGGPGVANALEQQVRHRGFFERHTSARKNALGAGTWTVSLTYPNGQPLLCGQDARPCRFTIYVG